MVFDADAYAAEQEEGLEDYEFKWKGEQHVLPHPNRLTEEQARMVRDDQLFDVLDKIAPDASAALLEMPVHTSGHLAEEWFEMAGDEGKSQPKSSAPNRSARRSKRTSKSAASS